MQKLANVNFWDISAAKVLQKIYFTGSVIKMKGNQDGSLRIRDGLDEFNLRSSPLPDLLSPVQNLSINKASCGNCIWVQFILTEYVNSYL